MPTDAAFKHLTSTRRDAIATLSSDDAKRFVSHFVVPGLALKSNNIDQDITAEDGTSYNVTWFMGRLSLRDHRGPAPGPLAFVVDGDNPAGPGMIDAVDSVLMPAFLDRPAPADLPTPVAAASPPAPVPPPVPPPSAPPAPTVTAPVPAPAVAAPPTPPASTSASNSAPTDAMPPGPKLAPPAPQPQPTPPTVAPAVAAAPAKLDLNVSTANLRGWPVRTSGNGPSGKDDRVVVGVSSGRNRSDGDVRRFLRLRRKARLHRLAFGDDSAISNLYNGVTRDKRDSAAQGYGDYIVSKKGRSTACA